MFNLQFLKEIRAREMDHLLELIPPGSKVLEFGAGTGEQARILAEHGYDVVAIDLKKSEYSRARVFAVSDYDGERIPLDDNSVDVIFSSNVLEHVENLPAILREFKRVLKPGGFELHVMPTPAWRAWTFLAGPPTAVAATVRLAEQLLRPPEGISRATAAIRNAKTALGSLLPLGHGTSIQGISELWTFSPRFWKRLFAKHGHRVVDDRPLELFHTGHMLFGRRMSLDARERLSRKVGSAAHIYLVEPVNDGS